MNENKMKTRKEIHREYKERVKPSGVYQVKNLVNGKVLLGSSLNLEGPLNRHRFMLKINSHPSRILASCARPRRNPQSTSCGMTLP